MLSLHIAQQSHNPALGATRGQMPSWMENFGSLQSTDSVFLLVHAPVSEQRMRLWS